MLTRPCSLFESTKMPATPSASKNFSELVSKGPHLHVIANSPSHFAVEVGLGLLRRGLHRDLREQDPRSLEPAFVRASSSADWAFTWTTGPRFGAFGRGAPAGRFEQDSLLDRHDHAALGLAPGPCSIDRPRLEMRHSTGHIAETYPASTGWPSSGSASRSTSARSCRRGIRCWPSAPIVCRSLRESPGSPP